MATKTTFIPSTQEERSIIPGAPAPTARHVSAVSPIQSAPAVDAEVILAPVEAIPTAQAEPSNSRTATDSDATPTTSALADHQGLPAPDTADPFPEGTIDPTPSIVPLALIDCPDPQTIFEKLFHFLSH